MFEGRKRNVKNLLVVRIILVIGIVLVVVLVMLFAASGILLNPKYLAPWNKNYALQFTDPRISLVACGELAANGHNMQPWVIKLDPTNPMVFYLYADSTRLTPEVDPYARQTMITQGTFLEYVQVGGEKLGYATDIKLFPDGNYDEQNLMTSMNTMPVAKITLTKVASTNSPLFDDMFLPDTNRDPYQTTHLTTAQITRLEVINNDPDLTIQFYQDSNDLTTLGNFVMAGAKIESGIHRINVESAGVFRANEYQKNQYRYGFSLEGQDYSGILKQLMQGLITIIPAFNNEKTTASLFVSSTQKAVDHTPAYAMIITKDNSRVEQVEAGMFYSRLVLTAHSMGFVMQPPSQVLEEYPEMAAQHAAIQAEYAPDGGTIQMFIRLGEPTKNALRTMREDVTELIKN